LRGLLAAAVSGATVAAGAKVSRRRLPAVAGMVAAAGAGAALELPVVVPLAAAATAFAARRARAAGHGPPAIAAITAAGAAGALATERWWPVPPQRATEVAVRTAQVEADPRPTGAGITIVVNADAGPTFSDPPDDTLHEALPDAGVVLVEEGDDLGAAVRQAGDAGDEVKALGIAGGDGSVNTAAAVALEHGAPLMVIPAGTLNHLARDLGLLGIDDAIRAVQRGEAIAMDVGEIGGRLFLNTASFGSYPALVDARERLEERIGKWPALVVAAIRVLRHDEPVEVELDGRRRRLWMVFIGNCRYHPPGFAPSWRERLDDRQLDVRLVDADRRFARLRLIAAIVTGTLAKSAVYESYCTDRVEVRSLDGALRLARDGETFDGGTEFVVCKHDDRLTVYVPFDES
jgi:undecaprenyl-diphosphatase